MGKIFDLDGMSVEDMWSLHRALCQTLALRLTQEKRELERRLAQLNREQLVTSPEAIGEASGGAAQSRRKYPPVYPKFRNLEAPYEAWSGRGKQPRWLTAALEAGRSLEDFAISEEEQATAREQSDERGTGARSGANSQA